MFLSRAAERCDCHACVTSYTPGMAYVIKAEIADLAATTFELESQKTMYGGKAIAAGDVVFIFASENEGGPGLLCRGVVTAARAVARKPGVERQTPRVNVVVKRTALAKRPLGRTELRPFTHWDDGRPETELNFKFYRQATNKIGGISERATAFLETFFGAARRLACALRGVFLVPLAACAFWRPSEWLTRGTRDELLRDVERRGEECGIEPQDIARFFSEDLLEFLAGHESPLMVSRMWRPIALSRTTALATTSA